MEELDRQFEAGVRGDRWDETDDDVVDSGYEIGVTAGESDREDIDDDFGGARTRVEDASDVSRDQPQDGVTGRPREHERADPVNEEARYSQSSRHAAESRTDHAASRAISVPDQDVSHAAVARARAADHHPVPREVSELQEARREAAQIREKGTKGTFGEILANDESGQVNFLGGNREERETAAFHTMVHTLKDIRTQQLSGDLRRETSVVVANFNPGDDASLFSLAAVPDLYEVGTTTVAGQDGFLARLYSDELADTLSRAAAESQADRRAFNSIFGPLCKAVGAEVYDPVDKVIKIGAPDLLTLRDALTRARSGPRGEGYSSLTETQEKQVDRALDKPFKELNNSTIILAESFIADLVRARGVQAQGRYAPRYEPPGVSRFSPRVPKLRVEEVNVTDSDDSQAPVLSQGLVHYIRATRPAAVLFQDVDKGDGAGITRAVDECRRLGIRAYVSAETLQDEQVQRLVQRGAHAVMPLSAGDRNVVSEMLGTFDGEEVNSESINVGGNEGGSANQSTQEGYEGTSTVAKTSGVSGAVDESHGIQVGITQNVQIGDIPVARAGHLGAIKRGQLAVFTTGPEPRQGLFDLDSLRRIGEFPPPGPQRIRVEGHLARIAAQQGVAGMPGTVDPDAKGSPLAIESTQPVSTPAIAPARNRIQMPTPPQQDELATLQVHGRLNRLRQSYGHRESFGFGNRGVSRGFSEYLDLEAANRNMDPDDFRRWVGLD